MHNWLTKKHWYACLETHYCLLKWLILLILIGQWWEHKGERQRKAHLGTQKKIQWWEPYSYMAGYSADLLRNLADKKKRKIRFQVPNTIFVWLKWGKKTQISERIVNAVSIRSKYHQRLNTSSNKHC